MSSNTFAEYLRREPAYSRETFSAEETRELSLRLGALLKGGDWLVLEGELGTGKTLFIKGVAEALNVAESPTSPTFSLIQLHRPRPGVPGLSLCHIDLYRLGGNDIAGLEWDELMGSDGVTDVEWAEKAASLWPPQSLPIKISHQGSDRRLWQFYSYGERSAELIRRLKASAGDPGSKTTISQNAKSALSQGSKDGRRPAGPTAPSVKRKR